MIKKIMLILGLCLVIPNLYSMRFRPILRAATNKFLTKRANVIRVAKCTGCLALPFAIKSIQDSKWVKPDWAVKYLPSGVPKDVDKVVYYLNNMDKFKALGAKMPKGILLYGAPGTGKTAIVRVIAKAVDAEFIHCSASELSARMYGEGSDKIKTLFKVARESAKQSKTKKAILFIDEIDLFTDRNVAYDDKRTGYREQLTELLNQLDGFAKDDSVIVIAATNHPENIDSALLRPGRLGMHVYIPKPDFKGRQEIAQHYVNALLYKGKDISHEIARRTEGYTPAEIESLINDSAINAAYENADAVTDEHINNELKKISEKNMNNAIGKL